MVLFKQVQTTLVSLTETVSWLKLENPAFAKEMLIHDSRIDSQF
jgi:hypothetical protein